MEYFLLYLIIGMITAVWTAINHLNREAKDKHLDTPPTGAYILIAIAWPFSIVILVYTVFNALFFGETPHHY